jgi:uncharacterized membrane protein YheB (UPF0754 family)
MFDKQQQQSILALEVPLKPLVVNILQDSFDAVLEDLVPAISKPVAEDLVATTSQDKHVVLSYFQTAVQDYLNKVDAAGLQGSSSDLKAIDPTVIGAELQHIKQADAAPMIADELVREFWQDSLESVSNILATELAAKVTTTMMETVETMLRERLQSSISREIAKQIDSKDVEATQPTST